MKLYQFFLKNLNLRYILYKKTYIARSLSSGDPSPDSHWAASGWLQALILWSKWSPFGQATTSNFSWLHVKNEEQSSGCGTKLGLPPRVLQADPKG